MTSWITRGRQFWSALTAKPTAADLAEARGILTPTQYALFTRLQPSEKVHAVRVMRKVRESSEDPDLLTAALLHDIGKIIQPLSLWERVLVALAPRSRTRRTGETLQDEPTGSAARGWTRALVVADKHASWGAQLAHKAGAPRTVIQLIRRHADPPLDEPHSRDDELLALLQAADDRF